MRTINQKVEQLSDQKAILKADQKIKSSSAGLALLKKELDLVKARQDLVRDRLNITWKFFNTWGVAVATIAVFGSCFYLLGIGTPQSVICASSKNFCHSARDWSLKLLTKPLVHR